MTQSRDRLAIVPPFLLSAGCLDAVRATARAMARQHAMLGEVSLAWALRELIARGCDILDAQLRAGAAPALVAAHPPRGARRREADTATRAPEAADAFASLAPFGIQASLRKRVTAQQVRLGKALGRKTTLAATLRELISRGLAARAAEQRAAEARQRELRAFLERVGWPDPAALAPIVLPVVVPYSPPGPKPAFDRKPASRRAVRPKAAAARPVSARPTGRSSPRGRARTPRRTPSAAGPPADEDDGPTGSNAPTAVAWASAHAGVRREGGRG